MSNLSLQNLSMILYRCLVCFDGKNHRLLFLIAYIESNNRIIMYTMDILWLCTIDISFDCSVILDVR